MILGLGGGFPFPLQLQFPFQSNNGDHHFPFSKVGPIRAHFFTAIVSKGPFNQRGCHIKKSSFFQGLNDVTLAGCTSCFCFFDGNSSGQETGKEVASPQNTFINNLFRGKRWTSALLATNVLLYVAQIATHGKLMLWGAKVNSLIDEGQLWRLLTSSFLHANIGHLLVNCYSLHSVGPTVENLCGTRRFLTIYFASAVASSAMSYWLSEAPAVGASGAIFGLVGSVSVFSMRHRNVLGSGAQDLKQIAQILMLNMIIGLSSSGIDNWGHMARLISTPRKRNARKVTYRSPDSPYQVKMRYGENVQNYVHRLAHAIHSFHLNALEGNSDFLTPARQAHILIYNLPRTGPLGALRAMYRDVYVNGVPNMRRYSYKGRWILTLNYLERRMMDEIQMYECIMNDDDEDDEDGDNEDLEIEEDPEEDEE